MSPNEGREARRARGWLLPAAVALVAIAVLAGWYVAWQYVAPPAVACSVDEEQWCEDTLSADWIGLSGRPTAIEVRPPPSEWASSSNPGFAHADWAALVDRAFMPSLMAACYYSSERAVTCHAEEGAGDR